MQVQALLFLPGALLGGGGLGEHSASSCSLTSFTEQGSRVPGPSGGSGEVLQPRSPGQGRVPCPRLLFSDGVSRCWRPRPCPQWSPRHRPLHVSAWCRYFSEVTRIQTALQPLSTHPGLQLPTLFLSYSSENCWVPGPPPRCLLQTHPRPSQRGWPAGPGPELKLPRFPASQLHDLSASAGGTGPGH